MDAVVTGEDRLAVGLSVLDDRGVEHVLDVRKADGAIPAHESEGYPDDPADRHPEDAERIDRVRRFARYYLYRKRGHSTLRPRKNPDHVAAAALALADAPRDRVEELLWDPYRQARGGAREVSPPPSPGGEGTDAPVYRQELYLGIDDGGAPGILRIAATSAVRPGGGGRPAGARPPDRRVTGADGGPPDAVPDRPPDARIEVPAFDPASVESFRWQLVRHLFCQVRDCYLGAGIAPPEGFRIRGPGRVEAAARYERYECYDRYHDPDAAVGTWFEAPTPDRAHERRG